MKRILTITLSVAFLASCASSSSHRNPLTNADVSKNSKIVLADKNSTEKVICKQQMRLGTHRKTTVCRTQGEMKAEREATQRALLPQQNQTGTGVPVK